MDPTTSDHLSELRAATRAVETVAEAALDGSTTYLLTLQEAADALRIGRTKLYELIGAGALPTRYIGRRRVVAAPDLAEFIRSLPTEPAA